MLRLFTLLLTSALLLGCGGDAPQRQFGLTEQAGLFAASINSTGERIAVGTVSHGGSLWQLEDGTRLFDWNHGDAANSLIVATAFSPDGQTALTAERNSVVIWNVDTGTPRHFFATEGDVLSAAISDGGRHALLGLRNQTALLVHTDGRRAPSFIPHAGFVTQVAISADGQMGATGSDDGMVRVWQLDSGEATLTRRLAAGISTLALTRDGALLFAAPAHGPGEVWDLLGRRLLSNIGKPRGTFISARFSADRNTLLTGEVAASASLWQVIGGAELRRWTAPRTAFWHDTRPSAMAVAFNTRRPGIIAVMSDGKVIAWGP